MLRRERQARIIGLLKEEKSVTIKDLAQRLDVSVITIRRDFEELSRSGQIKKVYGGAVLPDTPPGQPGQPFFTSRLHQQRAEKIHIAAEAARLVEDGDLILLDIGTTCLEVARQLKDRKHLTVLTNSIPILVELMDSELEVYSLGGQLRSKQQSLYGSIALKSLGDFCVNRAFISVAGITLANGLTGHNRDSAELCAAIIQRAEQAVLVADSRKFGKNSMAVIGPLDCVDTIITDAGLSKEYADEIRARGIDLIIAGQ